MEPPTWKHPGRLEDYHPNPKPEKFHESKTRVKKHPKGIYKPFYSNFVCGGGKRHICCPALEGQPGCTDFRTCCPDLEYVKGDDATTGCKERFQCCEIPTSSTSPLATGCSQRYDCCKLEKNSKGCNKVCKKCDEPWEPARYNAQGCTNIDEKPHNVIDLNSKDEVNEA